MHPEGFVVISNHSSLNPVICYSIESDITDESIIYDILRADLTGMIAAIKVGALSLDNIEKNQKTWGYLIDPKTKPSTKSEVGAWPNATSGWITTDWGQTSFYNDHCPDDPNTIPGDNTIDGLCATGCVATAMGQVINYWGEQFSHLDYVSFIDNNDYTSRNNPDDGYGLRVIPITASDASFDSLDYPLNEDEIALLLFAAGVASKTEYSDSESGALFEDAADGFIKDFRFRGAEHLKDIDENFFDTLISNMQNGMPALLGMSQSAGPGRHAIICDGYKIDDFQVEHYHLNIGAQDFRNIWYQLPVEFLGFDIIEEGILNISFGKGIPSVRADELVINKKCSIQVTITAAEDGDYYVGIWDDNGWLGPKWEWLEDYAPLAICVGSYKVNLSEGQEYTFVFDVIPEDGDEDFEFWLYKKTNLGVWWPVNKIHQKLYATPDTTFPYVVECKPGTTPESNIRMYFSEHIDLGTVDQDNIIIEGSLSGLHDFWFEYAPGNDLLSINPHTDLIFDETVTVTITTSVTDLAQNPIDGDEDGVA